MAKDWKNNNLQNSLWRHWKNNHVYTIVAYKDYFIEATNEPAIVYKCIDPPSKIRWVRSYSEFMDGRFKRILKDEEKE